MTARMPFEGPPVVVRTPASRSAERESAAGRRIDLVALALAAALAAAALLLRVAGQGGAEQVLLLVLAGGAGLEQAVAMVRALLRGRFGLDVLALAAIVATVAVGELWAAAVVVLMLTGGRALEAFAQGRAGASLGALLRDAPRVAHRPDANGTVVDVDPEGVRPGDRLLVRPGEAVPVDLVVVDRSVVLDESRLTGESLPVERAPGDRVLSGAVVQGTPLVGTAVAQAADSEYQRIIALVAEAAASRAPMVRLADRWALPFTVVAFALAAVGWAVSGDPVRFAEVLVVATPCPLLLAVPIAFVAGMGRAAGGGVVVKHGAALEVLSRVRTVAFDKTGTLTRGTPEVERVEPVPPRTAAALLATAAAVERASAHPLAAAVVRAAQGAVAGPAVDAREVAGGGVSATVGGVPVLVGRPDFLAANGVPIPAGTATAGIASVIHVAIDGRYAGRLLLTDPIRSDASGVVERLRRLGIQHLMMLTGDTRPTAEAVARVVGIDELHASCRPEDKVAAVRRAVAPVLMVGDGVNDAPVLAAADLGFAMGARGAAAASDAADVVGLRDGLETVAFAVEVGRRTTSVALRAVALGIGLSCALMLVALTGVLPATVGALLQEGVDLATILSALAALGGGRLGAGRVAPRGGTDRASGPSTPPVPGGHGPAVAHAHDRPAVTDAGADPRR